MANNDLRGCGCQPEINIIVIITGNFQGDYNVVINDYIRAKSLFADTDVKIFKKGILVNLLSLTILC